MGLRGFTVKEGVFSVGNHVAAELLVPKEGRQVKAALAPRVHEVAADNQRVVLSNVDCDFISVVKALRWSTGLGCRSLTLVSVLRIVRPIVKAEGCRDLGTRKVCGTTVAAFPATRLVAAHCPVEGLVTSGAKGRNLVTSFHCEVSGAHDLVLASALVRLDALVPAKDRTTAPPSVVVLLAEPHAVLAALASCHKRVAIFLERANSVTLPSQAATQGTGS